MLRLTDPAPSSREFAYVLAALSNDALVVVPTDTVYGIAASAHSPSACEALYKAKRRDMSQPIAVVFANIDQVLDSVDELTLRARIAFEALLPGPWTLLVRNPARAFAHLCGNTPDVLGVRVPAGAMPLPPLAATSANLPGEPEAEVVSALAPELVRHVTCAIDRGALPAGHASTVLDLTEWELDASAAPRVIRDPDGRAPAALELLATISA